MWHILQGGGGSEDPQTMQFWLPGERKQQKVKRNPKLHVRSICKASSIMNVCEYSSYSNWYSHLWHLNTWLFKQCCIASWRKIISDFRICVLSFQSANNVVKMTLRKLSMEISIQQYWLTECTVRKVVTLLAKSGYLVVVVVDQWIMRFLLWRLIDSWSIRVG